MKIKHLLNFLLIVFGHLHTTNGREKADLISRGNVRVGEFTFELEDPFITENNEQCSVASGCLTLVSEQFIADQSDALGLHSVLQLLYETSTGTQVQFSTREYTDGIKIYKQFFPSRLTGTNTGIRDGVSTGWPIFKVPREFLEPGNITFITPGGFMAGWTLLAHGDIKSDGYHRFRDGEDGGIVVFTEPVENRYESVVMSYLSEPMAMNVALDKVASVLQWGVKGLAISIPQNYSVEVIVTENNHSTIQNILGWGSAMQQYFSTSKMSDDSASYLSYYTDNGASYYYNPDPYEDYEALILDLHQYSTGNNIPFQYLQLDSWWYYKGAGNGVKNWTAMPTVFPNGIEGVHSATGWPIVAHNRYFSSDTDYAIQNGGDYIFFVDEFSMKSLPLDKQFWDDLFEDALKWGIVTYEQDWLDRQYEGTSILNTDVTAGSTWLNQMGDSAREKNLTIQYCMSLTRHLLHSAQLPAVTQIRVSSDYLLGIDQWRIGVSSLFVYALGLKPYKDVFWTSERNENVPYNDCQTSSNYNGHLNYTHEGVKCIDWTDFGYDEEYGNETLRLNLCRNPENIGAYGAFCYTYASFDILEERWIWEYCDPPTCEQDCYTFNGVNYVGGYNITESGSFCSDWNGTYGLYGSFCRNPSNEEAPWCFVNLAHTKREFCDNKCVEITEGNVYLQSAVATLSTGPVGIGDKMENLNVDLIFKSINSDGLILKPSTPLLATEASFYLEFGELWTATSDISSYSYGILFLAERSLPIIEISPLQLNLENVLDDDTIFFKNYPVQLEKLSIHQANSNLFLSSCGGYMEFCLYYFSPIFKLYSNEMAVLGELSKWAPISPQRLSNIIAQGDTLDVGVMGVINEEVTISFWSNSEGVFNVECNFVNKTSMIINANTKQCL